MSYVWLGVVVLTRPQTGSVVVLLPHPWRGHRPTQLTKADISVILAGYDAMDRNLRNGLTWNRSLFLHRNRRIETR